MPERGTYRVFVEFYRAEVRHVAAYTVEVHAMTDVDAAACQIGGPLWIQH